MGENFHVLSNTSFLRIIAWSTVIALFLGAIFSSFGARDASPNQPKKGIVGKVAPYIVLLVFLSELVLLIYRCVEYPWSSVAEPTHASMVRELQYMGVSDSYPLFGWATDEQLPIIMKLCGSLLWFSWTMYAFHFKRSDTSWWKKLCKVIA